MTDTPSSTRTDVAERFIHRLDKLNPAKTRGAKRQHLAELRKSLSFDLGTHVPAFPYVEPFVATLDESTGYWRRAMFYLVAGLYASHPESASQGGFGKAMAVLSHRRESGSLEKRFLALLAAEEEKQLVYHLRQLVSLLKAEGIGLNYAALLRDLFGWQNQSRYVQRRWAQQYYGFNPDVPDTSDTKENQKGPR